MQNKIVKLSEVSPEVVKIVGVIEFLEGEISFEGKQIESFKKGVVEAMENKAANMVESYVNCINISNDRIRDYSNKVKIQKELLSIYELEYKDGSLYRYTNEDHEEWLMEQIDPNMNGGVL